MIDITVNSVAYPVPSSAADQDWAAKQIAFEQALAAGVNAGTAGTAANTAAIASLTTAVGADVISLNASIASLSAQALPTDAGGTVLDPTIIGVTSYEVAYSRVELYRVSIDYRTVAFLGAGLNSVIIDVWTLPPSTRVQRVIADINTPFVGGAIAACTLKVGRTNGGDEFLKSADILSAPIVMGATQADWGAGILGGTGFASDILWGVATPVRCQFDCAGANFDDLASGRAIFYIEGASYPFI